MPEIKLKIGDLILDHDNPRITHAEGQQEALQKIVKDQKTKLVKLAQSITEHGLNPMDRLLVLRVHQKPERFIALEGNRRVAVFMILTNPHVMTGLEMPQPMKNLLQKEAKKFSKTKVEPISCFEMGSRQEGDYWLKLRHKGENQGAGIVDWTSLASARFQTKAPVVQALEMVTERGGLSADQRSKITDRFPTSTLQRFLEDRLARRALGLDVRQGKLVTKLPAGEVVKGLRRVVLDLATKKRRVGSLMKTDQMLDYIRDFDAKDRPDESKARREERTLDEIPISEFPKSARTTHRRKPDPSDRREIVPKGCPLHVTDNRISEIFRELRILKLDEASNAIAVLLRVFLELSIDHFLTKSGESLQLTDAKSGKKFYKSLDKKLSECIEILVKVGVPREDFDSVTRAISNKSSPLHIGLLHSYIHSRFETPTPQDLKAAWTSAQPLFERIWPMP